MGDGREGLSRRSFLESTGLLAGHVALAARRARAAEPLPVRPLGAGGERVPILGLGCACAGQSRLVSREQAAEVYRTAIDEGVTYLDCARGYGKAEDVLGDVLAGRRDEVFLTTKAAANDAAGARESFEDSLRRLKTDHVDLLYWHGVGGRSLDHMLDPEGVLGYLSAQKLAGKARWIGFTTHSHPTRMKHLVDSGVIDVLMVIVNFVDRWQYDFEHKLLPYAAAKGVGIVAMKVYGGVQGTDWGRYDRGVTATQMPPEHLELAYRYALSVPGVTTAVLGCHTAEQVRQNAAMARRFAALSEVEWAQVEALGQQLVAGWQPRFGPTA